MILRIILGLLFCCLLIGYGYTVYFFSHDFMSTDFSTFHYAVTLYLHHHSIYQTISIPLTTTTQMILPPNLNPPFFNVLMLPLGLVSFFLAANIWGLLLIIFVIISIRMLYKYYLTAEISFIAMITAMFCYFPFYYSIVIAQVTGILLLLFATFWITQRKYKDIIAGILLGILCSLKIFFGLYLVYYAFRRRWQLLGFSLISMFCCSTIAMLIYGVKIFNDYHQQLSTITWIISSTNASLLAYFGRWFGIHESNLSIMQYPAITYGIYYIAIIAIVFYIFHHAKKQEISTDKEDLLFALIVTSSLLISPLGWTYYFPLLLIPYLILYKSYHAGNYHVATFLLLQLALLLSSLPTRILSPEKMQHGIIGFDITSGYFYSLIILAVLLIYHLQKDKYKSVHPVKANQTVLTMKSQNLIICATLLPSTIIIIKVFLLLWLKGEI